MDSMSLKQVISATNRRNPVNPFHFYTRKPRLHFQTRRFRFKTFLLSKQSSDFQDFQIYVKPSRLLPATEVKVCTVTSLKRFLSASSISGSRSLYKVEIQTSNLYGSSLSDLNAGILLCLIDENGDSILQRMPASSIDPSAKTEDRFVPDIVHFQRGCSDEFTFEGPRLGEIEALWISLESGQWRLGGASLTVINACQPSLKEDDGEETQCFGYCYDFEVDDILLGEGSEASMVEIRPSHITELSVVDPVTILSKSLSQSTSLLNGGISNEESMKEYADLKFSLLLYDAILIFVGTSVASFSVGEGSGFAFLIGGVSGFLYLLLLQRSIDGLPAPESLSRSSGGTLDKGFKGPLLSVALAVGFSVLAVKYNSGDDIPFMLTPKELLVGMMGFLACKGAVVLAAFKPLSLSLRENK